MNLTYSKPILIGALIAIAGVAPWALLASLNASIRPDLPWAALVTTIYLVVLISWLHGVGGPKSSSMWRKQRLRLWSPSPSKMTEEGDLPVSVIVILLVMLYLVWIVIGRTAGTPDLQAFPTTAYRFSILIMGAIVSGVVEEAAFRGYMQTGLEALGSPNAIVITAVVFTLFHGVHGIQALLFLGPGLFIASVLYSLLAKRTGTILPGMVIHATGDAAYTFFGVLGGDWTLLFIA